MSSCGSGCHLYARVSILCHPRVSRLSSRRQLSPLNPSFHVRSYGSTSISRSGSWFSRIYTSLIRRGVFGNDDYSNPKKRLERNYLYYSLLALQFRALRLQPLATSTRDSDEASNDCDNDSLYDQATERLDSMGLDEMSNVMLRQHMQSMLQPQVTEIFGAFVKVDAQLGLSIANNASSKKENDSDETATTTYDFMLSQSDRCKDILLNEWDRTRQQLSESASRSASSVEFLYTKQEAIELLASFHGWSLSSISLDSERNNSDGGSGDTLDAFGMNRTNETDSPTLPLIRHHQTINLCRSALIRDEIGYSVLALRSNVDTNGRGLFVDGDAMSGSLLAFQPGDVWPKEHLLTSAPDVMAHFDDQDDDDCHISLRFDDYVVDSRRSPVTVLTKEGSMNPWALGHMVNHPNAPILPNCMSTMLNYTDDMQVSTSNSNVYIPNTYAKAPSWQSSFFDPDVLMHGLCLLARRDVCDEELLYDYRLQTDEPPDWYSVVKYEDGFEEDQVVFFKEQEKRDPK